MNKTAFLFPGQGSQSLGMMSELASRSEIFRDTFEEASAVLGYDLWEITQNGPVERLNRTEVTQPAMLTSGVATWRVWQDVVSWRSGAQMRGSSLPLQLTHQS